MSFFIPEGGRRDIEKQKVEISSENVSPLNTPEMWKKSDFVKKLINIGKFSS